MQKDWRKINPKQLNENVFKTIGDDWVLITAGSPNDFNTMTAAWGTLGILWSRPVAICFIRPTRYTYSFMENSDTFSISFFGEEHKEILNYCGTHSGRNVNKISETGLNPQKFDLPDDGETIGFQQSRLIICCKKIYAQDMTKDCFVDQSLVEDIYPKSDFHKLYAGEILVCYTKE